MGRNIEEIYSDHIAEHSQWISPYPDVLADKVQNYIQNGEMVVDIGCGNGELLKHLSDRKPEAYFLGIDISPKALENASGLVSENPRVEMFESSLQDYPEAENFDVATAINSVQAMEDPEQALSEIYNRLKDDGTALLTVPNREVGMEIWPDRTLFYDPEKELDGIEIRVEVEDRELNYSQYLIGEDWLKQTAEKTGFNDIYTEEQISLDLRGIEYLENNVHEDDKPEIADEMKQMIDDDEWIREHRENPEIGPSTSLWVMQK